MYLIDTNVISEARKGTKANPGVQQFFANTRRRRTLVFLSVVTVGELRRGVELIRHRGDLPQAAQLETWLDSVLDRFADCILDIDSDVAQLWGRLRVPQPENALDKQIAATALIHDLTVVTRNRRHLESTGVAVLDPFAA
jgi:predicted nucleic acid-binding protein